MRDRLALNPLLDRDAVSPCVSLIIICIWQLGDQIQENWWRSCSWWMMYRGGIKEWHFCLLWKRCLKISQEEEQGCSKLWLVISTSFFDNVTLTMTSKQIFASSGFQTSHGKWWSHPERCRRSFPNLFWGSITPVTSWLDRTSIGCSSSPRTAMPGFFLPPSSRRLHWIVSRRQACSILLTSYPLFTKCCRPRSPPTILFERQLSPKWTTNHHHVLVQQQLKIPWRNGRRRKKRKKNWGISRP